MEENFYREFLRNDYNALQFLIYKIWEKKFHKSPELSSGDFAGDANEVHRKLVKQYGYKSFASKESEDMHRHFRDQLSLIISGKINKIPNLQSIQSICHLYYENEKFEGEENDDWEKFKEEYRNHIDNYSSRKLTLIGQPSPTNGSKTDLSDLGQENKALQNSFTNFQTELKTKTEEILIDVKTLVRDISGLQKVSKIISESLSTRYVGNFPANIDEMIKLVPMAKKSLIVVCDFPAYGQFSYPERFGDYDLAFQNLLNRKKERPEITLVTYDLQRRFNDWPNHVGRSLEDFKQTAIYKRYFEISGLEEPKVKTIEEFYGWLDDKHRLFQISLHEKGARIFETGIDLRAFLWIVDEKDAIFCFNNYGKENREVSFRTNDKQLIESLHVIGKGAIENSVRKTNFNSHEKSQ